MRHSLDRPSGPPWRELSFRLNATPFLPSVSPSRSQKPTRSMYATKASAKHRSCTRGIATYNPTDLQTSGALVLISVKLHPRPSFRVTRRFSGFAASRCFVALFQRILVVPPSALSLLKPRHSGNFSGSTHTPHRFSRVPQFVYEPCGFSSSHVPHTLREEQSLIYKLLECESRHEPSRVLKLTL